MILDVHEMTLIADYFVIGSGSNLRHVRAMADGLTYDLKDMRAPSHAEGYGVLDSLRLRRRRGPRI